jgi:hypothetical protein
MKNVLIFYKDFSRVSDRYSHIGLGISAYMLEKTLENQGFNVKAFGVTSDQDIEDSLQANTNHVIIEAVWVDPVKLESWLIKYPGIKFAVRVHSQIGFLVVEPGALWQIKKNIELQNIYPNFKVATNSIHLEHWLDKTHNIKCQYLPNIYLKRHLLPELSIQMY